ncbi:unnamed protein product [Heterobilharzia americana]|nr:unnamed protein product [Heterobilharzia americana]
MEVSLSSTNHYTDLHLITRQSSLHLQHTHNIRLLPEDADNIHSLLNTLNGNFTIFSNVSIPHHQNANYCYTIHPQHCPIPDNNTQCSHSVCRPLHLPGKYDQPCPTASVADSISTQIQKPRLPFTNLCHLWHHHHIPLSSKRRMYSTCTTLHSILLYACQT